MEAFMFNHKLTLTLFYLLLFVCPAFSSSLPQAISYLYTQQHEDGSFGAATSFRDTCVAVETLLELGQKDDERLRKAIGYIKTIDVSTTDYLARKIRVLAKAGENVDELVQRLVSYQNEYYWDRQFKEDGGFGYEMCYPSDVIDTALAVSGLVLPEFEGKDDVLGLAWNCLLNMQGWDGYWRYSWSGEKSLSLTCLGIIALSELIESGIPPSEIGKEIKQTLDTTALYTILQNQNEDGSFCDGGIIETTNACSALAHTMYRDSERTKKAVSFIQSKQNTDGSWNNNVYETTLALQVLSVAKMPELTILPKSGTVGMLITVNGNGFCAGESVRIDLGKSVSVAVTTASTCCTFTTAFVVDTQPYGTHTISVIGITSGSRADGVFRILGGITAISPVEGTVGILVMVNGTGFGAGESVRVDLGNSVSVAVTTASTCGTFTAVFSVDNQAIGTKTIIARGILSGQKAYAYFVVKAGLSRLTMAGRVMDTRSNKPVKGIKIELLRGKQVVMATFTTTDGRYELRDIPLGEYSLKASKQRVEVWKWYGWVWKVVWDEYIPDTKEGVSLDSSYNLSSINFYMPRCNGYFLNSDYGYMQEKPNNTRISLETRNWSSSYRFYLYPAKPLVNDIVGYNSAVSGINGTSFWYWSWKERKWVYALSNWNIQKATIDTANNRLVIDVTLRGLWWCRTSFNHTYLLEFNEGNKKQASMQELMSAGYKEETTPDHLLERNGTELPASTVFLSPIPTQVNSAPLLSDDQAKTSIMVKDVRKDLSTAEIKLRFDPNKVKVADIESPTLPDTGIEIVIDKRIDNQKGEIEIKAVVREKERETETQQGQETTEIQQQSPLFETDEKVYENIEDVENIAPIANLILQPADRASGIRAPLLSTYDIMNAVSIVSIELKDTDGNAIEANVVGNNVVANVPEQNLKAVYCYPNPSTDGQINFENLTRQVRVQIYNIAGELVYDRTHTTDGKWVFRCENNDGDKVASGVYIYILTNPETGEIRKGKVGVIR